MKTNFYIISFSILLFLTSCNQESENEFYLPAEWEPQTGVIVGGLDDYAAFEMIVQLSKELNVYCRGLLRH